MLTIGTIQTLPIARLDGQGAWFAGDNGEDVLLPRKEVPAEAEVSDALEIFIYKHPKKGVIATRRRPQVQLGECALLRVKQTNDLGAFLEWGMEKDLFVPFSEQPRERLEEGKSYIILAGIDEQERMIGTAHIEANLEREKIELTAGEEVELLLWQFTDLGAKVIINNLYSGLVFKDELHLNAKVGDRLKGIVKQVRADKKIDVSLNKGGMQAIDDAARMLLQKLEAKPFLPLHDKSAPGEIQSALGISKKVFKRAVGTLYKAGKISLEKDGIRLKE